MAEDRSQRQADDDSGNAETLRVGPPGHEQTPVEDSEAEEGDEDEDEDEEEDKEPTLKYSRLTSHIPWVYRNGDSTSAVLVSGDKMIVGTHGGNIHVLSIPSLRSVRTYHAHSSSVTSISVSPYHPIFSTSANDEFSKSPNGAKGNKPLAASAASPQNSPNRQAVPATPSNAIYIATSSIDGHVCVSSLVDTKDVTLRNYARPVHAVAVSPAYKTDRTYLSGGTAANLVLTVGGKLGVSADANTTSAAAAASGWLGTIRIGSNTGKDSILHGNEGSITSIKWSLSGKYVVWNNEYGTRIMRSHMHLGASESDLAWKRIGHVPRPNRRVWEDMAGVWKARAEWIDVKSLNGVETADEEAEKTVQSRSGTLNQASARAAKSTTRQIEKLLVGWGDVVWMIHIHPGNPNSNSPAKAEIIHQVVFPDCIISGLTLYTPSLLVALVYLSKDNQNDTNSSTANNTPRRGRARQNGLPPDLRLIDLSTPEFEELEVESLEVRSFESLSAVDYSLSSLFITSPRTNPSSNPRGTLDTLGSGLKDVSLNATRLFSSSASVLSGSSSDGKSASTADQGHFQTPSKAQSKEASPFLANPGLKIFIHSQYDCVVAVKRNLSDQLQWLLDHQEYEEAWNLANAHPDIISPSPPAESAPETVSRSGQSLKDFFDDETSSQTTFGADKMHAIAVEREKQRIGDSWVNQLVSAGEWVKAGEVAGKTLGDSPRWSHWILTFAQSRKFDEITPYIPTVSLKPPLPSYVYDVVLRHYIEHDKERLQSLLDQWSPDLFDISSVISAIKHNLDSDDIEGESLEDEISGEHQNILLSSLAKLYLANDNPSAAIRCYVRVRNADQALMLIRNEKMIDAISDDIFTFIRIRISPEQRASAPLGELEDLASEPIRLLATAAIQDIIGPSTVVSQLEPKAPASRPYLFFYFRALWQGDINEDARLPGQTHLKSIAARRSRFAATEVKSRTVLSPHSDLVVTLFAEYSQPLLNDFLKTARDYRLEHALAECRRHRLIPELVWVLQKMGQPSEALHLIIDELDDVSMAVSFAKAAEDESIWLDLMDYSMDKPKFIRGLLEEVGTSIDPSTLVRRIPPGLEIPGLKDSLTSLIKEIETTWSITKGASRILNSEVAIVLTALRRRRERGLVFTVNELKTSQRASQDDSEKRRNRTSRLIGGECASCQIPISGAGSLSDPSEKREHLVGFPCGHLVHLSCLLDRLTNDSNKAKVDQLRKDLNDDTAESDQADKSLGHVGTKIRHAQMIRSALGDIGCYVCRPDPSRHASIVQNG